MEKIIEGYEKCKKCGYYYTCVKNANSGNEEIEFLCGNNKNQYSNDCFKSRFDYYMENTKYTKIDRDFTIFINRKRKKIRIKEARYKEEYYDVLNKMLRFDIKFLARIEGYDYDVLCYPAFTIDGDLIVVFHENNDIFGNEIRIKNEFLYDYLHNEKRKIEK